MFILTCDVQGYRVTVVTPIESELKYNHPKFL